MATLEEILQYHGNPGNYQIILWTSLLFTLFHVGLVQQFNILISHTPQHHCKDPPGTNWSQHLNASQIYPKHDKSCSIFIDPLNHTLGTKKCENGYEYKTINEEIFPSTEFNLVCDDHHWLENALALTFIGVLIGGLVFGQLADRFGRKKVLTFTVSLLCLLSTSIYFAPNLGAFIALRLLMGILSQGTQTICLTYGSELFLPTMRTLTNTAVGIMWAFILPLLAGMFYGFANWRSVHLAMGIFNGISAVYVWFLPESVSWLISKWRIDEAVKTLNSFARFNRIQVCGTLKEDLEKVAKQMQTRTTETNGNQKAKWTLLFKTPIMRRITISLLYIWFSTACTAYGMSFSISALKGNHMYVNYAITGVIELIVRIVFTILFVIFGRVTIMGPVLFSCGILTIAGFLTWHYVPTDYVAIQTLAAIVALIGRNLMAVNFTMIVVFTSELTPLSLRSTGVGFGFAAARLGNIFAPYTRFLKAFWVPLPQILYGIMAIGAGCVLITLPETFKKPMPNTIQDVEDLVRNKRNLGHIHTIPQIITPDDEELQLESLVHINEKDLNENLENNKD